MRTIIHIGTPKTGTSAIQKFFVEHKELLASKGFYYPEHPVDINGISSGNGAQLLHMMKIGKKETAKALRDTFYKKGKEKNLIISSESFYREPALTYELFPDAEIVVYIREQSEQILADYNQSVKRHFQIHFFNHILKVTLKNNDPFYNFELLDQWIQFYGRDRVHIRIYEPTAFPHKNIVLDFLNFLELDNSLYTIRENEQKVNVSYYRDAVHFKIWFNRLIKENHSKFLKEAKAIDYALQAFSQKCATDNILDYSYYTKEQKEKVVNFYRKYNNHIAQSYFNIEGNQLFKNSEEKNILYNYTGLKHNKIVEIARYIQNYSPEAFIVFQDLIVKSKDSSNKIIFNAGKKLDPLLAL